MLVEGHRVGQPLGARLGSDQDHHHARAERGAPAAEEILDDNLIEVPFALELADLVLEMYLDRRLALDAVRQVPSHRVVERVAADDQPDVVSLGGERERGLGRGVGPANHHRVVADAKA